jgi:hypothetical protein
LRTAEEEYVARRIVGLREDDALRRWTIAVVVTSSSLAEAERTLVPMLTGYGTSARVARGADVAQVIEDVVVTDPENIVGLEFDAVFVAHFDLLVGQFVAVGKSPHPAAWVAMTRARQLVEVTYCGTVQIFNSEALLPYRFVPS